jgi:hypothetical protein
MGLDELSVEVAGTPVRTYRAGTGPALVLLHGGGLDDARLTWAPVWDRLTAHVQVVAPDLPGYGGSPLGPTPATLEGYRTWLLEFLDACDLGQTTLAGLSLGGRHRLTDRARRAHPGEGLDVDRSLRGQLSTARRQDRLLLGPHPGRNGHHRYDAAPQRPVAPGQPPGPAVPSRRGHPRADHRSPRAPHPPGRRGRVVGLPTPRGGVDRPPHLFRGATRRHRLPCPCCCRVHTTGWYHPTMFAPRPLASLAPSSCSSPAPVTGYLATPPTRSPSSYSGSCPQPTQPKHPSPTFAGQRLVRQGRPSSCLMGIQLQPAGRTAVSRSSRRS